jgi:hypothetical protein
LLAAGTIVVKNGRAPIRRSASPTPYRIVGRSNPDGTSLRPDSQMSVSRAPAASTMRARRTSASAFPLSRNASVLLSRSSAFQNSGSQPARRNSSGSRSRAIATHALTPATNAAAIARASGP